MPSFDIVLEPDMVEVRNAVEQATKEIGTRFDFKGTSADVQLGGKGAEKELTMIADSDFQLGQVLDVLLAKLSKRGVDVRYIDQSASPTPIGGDRWSQKLVIKSGIDSDLGRKIQKLVKESKIKVQAAIQGDTVRCTGTKRDDLQGVIALLRREVSDVPLSFNNFRN